VYPAIYKLKNQGLNFLWIGWPGIIPRNEEEKQKITKLLADQKCIPIFLDSETIYLNSLFVDQHLYTLFHSFKGSDSNDLDLTADLWNAYKDVNMIFVNKLMEIKKEGDIVWINNLYLMLTPMFLKRQDISANIGFYLHCPFPSIDIYKVFIYRTEVLKSLLCCDVVGFHSFEYASNFFHSCEDILNLTVKSKRGGFIVIEYSGRNILIKVNHIGIN